MAVHVGCRAIIARDPIQDAPVRLWVLYPTHAAPQTVRFGPYQLELAVDAPPSTDQLAVVALSHGNGGTPWSHRGLARHLVGEGYAVVMIEHPGNNRHDNSLGSPTGLVQPILLEHRPRHVRIAVDAALADPALGPRLDRARYAIIGESIGAYTALAVAGGHAMMLPDSVEEARRQDPDAETRKLAFAVSTERDRRACAAVLIVPAIGFFGAPGALGDVEIPLLVRTGALDALCSSAQIERSLASVPDRAQISWTEVPGAGHFSFQTPYPPELASIPPAQDPPGFDRAGYQPVFHADVTRFLRTAIPS